LLYSRTRNVFLYAGLLVLLFKGGDRRMREEDLKITMRQEEIPL